MSKISKKLNQIYQDIDYISKKGREGYLEYVAYLDELLSKGEWSLFDEVMVRKYKTDISIYDSIHEVKSKTFNKVRFNTLSAFQEDLKDLYATQSVYQISFNVYDITTNATYGTIKENEISIGPQILYQHPEYTEFKGYTIVNLDVIGVTHGSTSFNSATQSLIDKYNLAIQFLK